MNKAIVTGSTGLIASGVVECLLDKGVEVLALGRRAIADSRIKHLDGHLKLTYLQLEMADIESLPERIKEIGWSQGSSCVFYHFAWSGSSRLADGSVQDQFNNVAYSSKAVEVAAAMSCEKFVNAGSQEERFVDKYLASYWTQQAYHSNMGVYGTAKTSARDMCLLLAYLKKIDYIHTRISVIIEPTLETNNYVNSMLRKIGNGDVLDPPLNHQLFDFISKEECGEVYYLLGKRGKNKSDYFVGSGNPMTLHEFFNRVFIETHGDNSNLIELPTADNWILQAEDFDNAELVQDLDYTPNFPSFNLNTL